MVKDKFEIGDIVKIRASIYSRIPIMYYILQGRRHLRGKEKEFIVFRIAEKNNTGTWILKQNSTIRVLGYKAARLFNSDKELLAYLMLLEKN